MDARHSRVSRIATRTENAPPRKSKKSWGKKEILKKEEKKEFPNTLPRRGGNICCYAPGIFSFWSLKGEKGVCMINNWFILEKLLTRVLCECLSFHFPWFPSAFLEKKRVMEFSPPEPQSFFLFLSQAGF